MLGEIHEGGKSSRKKKKRVSGVQRERFTGAGLPRGRQHTRLSIILIIIIYSVSSFRTSGYSGVVAITGKWSDRNRALPDAGEGASKGAAALGIDPDGAAPAASLGDGRVTGSLTTPTDGGINKDRARRQDTSRFDERASHFSCRSWSRSRSHSPPGCDYCGGDAHEDDRCPHDNREDRDSESESEREREDINDSSRD
eukprot:CAMPEP_0182423586 /NCGR_PEP_ID=MMETSP1167-20130531/9623_1 /TAXON_ID=2988 /ORGANISM="Mallomonas Sp, Strain CCMP3275" /LENGTH=197 /DNA_ID=CAMNT_0024602691 /DNA_START=141 /DNA_END=735 /DNA_ORIENTATION=+